MLYNVRAVRTEHQEALFVIEAGSLKKAEQIAQERLDSGAIRFVPEDSFGAEEYIESVKLELAVGAEVMS